MSGKVEETMGQNSAERYVTGLLDGMQANMENGTPFGVNDDGEEVTVWDYLEDVLEIRYLVDSELAYLGAQLLLSWGGPNVWLDTRERELSVYWWSDAAKGIVLTEFANQIDEALAELYEMKKGE